MKNSTAPNRKTGRMIAKNLIVLFTVALAGFCGIQAWFTDKRSAEANGIEVECQAPDGIEIAVVGHDAPVPANDKYTVGNITLNKTNCKFLENLQLTEITGDGTFFRKPALIQSGGQAHVDTKAEWSEPTANEHYLSFDLYIRSKSQYNISIGKKSTIKPDAPQLTTQDGTGIKNKSKYGNFSRDSVVGAVRFSVVDYKSAPPSKSSCGCRLRISCWSRRLTCTLCQTIKKTEIRTVMYTITQKRKRKQSVVLMLIVRLL